MPAPRWSRTRRSRSGTASKLTVHASLQMLNYNISELADSLGLEEDEGAPDLALSSAAASAPSWAISEEASRPRIAAMKLGRPVRVVMSRQQVFQCVMRRSETRSACVSPLTMTAR